MKIKVTSLYVDNQDKALGFYAEVLGFAKKTDFSNGPFRWLTVASPEDPDGTELQLALNNNPRGAVFTMPPTDVTGSTIAVLNDTCGNLIQFTQLARYSR
jgi:predicted enzyme related to lactoylglutathione lyase